MDERRPFLVYAMKIGAHLLWCYFMVLLASMPLLLILVSSDLLQKGQELSVEAVLAASVLDWFARYIIGGLHGWIFLTFRSTVWPRFMAYSPLLTFAMSSIIGSVIAGIAGFALISGHDEFDSLQNWLLLMFAVALLGGSLDRFEFWFSLGGVAPMGRWFGRLLVGKRDFDAFVEWNAERGQTPYQAYVQDQRRRRGQAG